MTRRSWLSLFVLGLQGMRTGSSTSIPSAKRSKREKENASWGEIMCVMVSCCGCMCAIIGRGRGWPPWWPCCVTSTTGRYTYPMYVLVLALAAYPNMFLRLYVFTFFTYYEYKQYVDLAVLLYVDLAVLLYQVCWPARDIVQQTAVPLVRACVKVQIAVPVETAATGDYRYYRYLLLSCPYPAIPIHIQTTVVSLIVLLLSPSLGSASYWVVRCCWNSPFAKHRSYSQLTFFNFDVFQLSTSVYVTYFYKRRKKVEFQPFNRSYSQLTFFNFL